MKVLMLNGSCNANGSTRAGLDAMATIFTQRGIETEIVCIGGKPIRDCIGCGKCGDLKRCAFQDDAVNDFVKKAYDADGFVFGTPVYYAHPSGRILSFLDRVFFSSAKIDRYAAFKLKPAASVAVARRAGTTASFDVLNKYFGIAGMLAVGSTYWNVFHGRKREDVPQDGEGIQTLENLARNLAWLARCIKAGRDAGVPEPKIKHEVVTNFVR